MLSIDLVVPRYVPFLVTFFSLVVFFTKYWVPLPVLYSRSFSAICFMCSSWAPYFWCPSERNGHPSLPQREGLYWPWLQPGEAGVTIFMSQMCLLDHIEFLGWQGWWAQKLCLLTPSLMCLPTMHRKLCRWFEMPLLKINQQKQTLIAL